MSWMTGEGKILSSFEAVKSSEGGDSWSLSPSERKPEQGQYRAGIYRTGICRSQNLILEVWKADWSDSISCIHLESYKMKHLDLLKRKSLFCFFSFIDGKCFGKSFCKSNVLSAITNWKQKGRWFDDHVVSGQNCLWICDNSQTHPLCLGGVALCQNNQAMIFTLTTIGPLFNHHMLYAFSLFLKLWLWGTQARSRSQR